MDSNQSVVLAVLRAAGAITAVTLGHRCGMAIEAVYEALVHFEAQGLAKLRVQFCGKRAISREWVAV